MWAAAINKCHLGKGCGIELTTLSHSNNEIIYMLGLKTTAVWKIKAVWKRKNHPAGK